MDKELMGILEELPEKICRIEGVAWCEVKRHKRLLKKAHTAIQEHYLGLLPKKITKLYKVKVNGKVNDQYATDFYNQAISEMERKIRGDV